MRDTMFVTGMQRSGTTLLERLLDAQAGLTILSQPFPLLFVEAKRAFLRERGFAEESYPLGHLFLERRYTAGDLAAFLSRYRPEKDFTREVFVAMEDYSGQYTRFDRAAVDAALVDESFVPTVSALHRGLALRRAAIAGGKETTCEEFLPALLAGGIRCALIIRDPRDILASLNHGRGHEFGGQLKPTLFNLRQWRKSVAFALELQGRPGFHFLLYEDLVGDSAAELQRLADALELGAIDQAAVTGEIHSQRGEVWAGNSSHGARHGISRQSVGAYRSLLPEAVALFTEAACYPELRLLGYDVSIDERDVSDLLRSFREPYETRADMPLDAAGEENEGHELRRLELLQDDDPSAVAPYFFSRRAYERLRGTMTRRS